VIRRLAALLASDTLRLALAGAAVSMGLNIISKMVDERRETLSVLDDMISERVTQFESLNVPTAYPAPEDLDPLGNGTGTPIGDQLAEEYQQP
jgi:hypothetical protein